MQHFHAQAGHLFCEDSSLSQICTEFDTPGHVYSAATLRDADQGFAQCNPNQDAKGAGRNGKAKVSNYGVA